MPKERINITVDESVYNELQAREDVNTSGLVNSFLKRYLRGEEADNAAKRLQAERLEREAEEKMEEAQSLKNQAQHIREEFEKERQEREKQWEQAIMDVDNHRVELKSVGDQSRPDTSNSAVQYWSDEFGIAPEEFVRKYEQRTDDADTGSDTSTRHYQ